MCPHTCCHHTQESLGPDFYRILDANLNRAKEGLRVCEEITRFHLREAQITKKLRLLRHHLTTIVKNSGIKQNELFACRNSREDLGKNFKGGKNRKSFRGIFMANAQRVKESLRVLEEFLKITKKSSSQDVQKLRFLFYDLEKKAVEKCPGLLDP
jgi:thiamine-phosphate pyrophosphorylase